ncbi:hypothetical protein ACFZDF_08970 [Streptomyces sp. NPDC007910]|uniref:hypothetical protein n=1 Tax=Streptomyces sp. NPDC007910 TaxID=3364790 RepID=UPI0036E6F566
MSENPSEESRDRMESAVGCLLAVLGVTVAGDFALPRAAYSIEGGFEAHARDWGLILVDLPLILFAGLVVPPLTWAAATRWLRPWAAALLCAAVVALGLWLLSAVWHPRQDPDPGYGPGI